MNDTARTYLLAVATRFVLAAGLWLVLAEGALYRWWFGLLVAAVAVAISLPLLPPADRRVRIFAIIRFIPVFLWLSMHGGVDVGRRVIRPIMNIEPDFVRLPLHIERGPARLWLVAAISLMPGTLSCRLEEDHLQLHVLDVKMDLARVVRRIEWHMAAIFSSPRPSRAQR